MTTTQYLILYAQDLKPGQLPVSSKVYPVPDIWPDGTRRLQLKDMTVPDRQVYTRYKDLMVYDLEGNYILELCIANTDVKLDKRYDKMVESYSRMVPHQPKNPVGRNEPCPCGATKDCEMCRKCDIKAVHQTPVKFKHCHGHWSKPRVAPAKTEPVEVSPEVEMASQAFADGHISQEELYYYAGFVPDEDGEYVRAE
jgi:hypothetical protein